jgi:hypothetical protein
MRGGINFSDKGFNPGGRDGSGGLLSTSYKTAYSTDTETAGNAISSTRSDQGGLSDGTYCYIGGDTAVTTDKITNSTEVIASVASAALGTYASGYCFAAFPASSGYRSYNNGSTSYSRKMPFSTATDANNANIPTGNIRYGSQVTDGIAFAYFSGLAAANKLASSTDIYASLTVYPVNVQGASASYAAL